MTLIETITLAIPFMAYGYFQGLPFNDSVETVLTRNQNGLIVCLVVAGLALLLTGNQKIAIAIAVIGFVLWYLSR